MATLPQPSSAPAGFFFARVVTSSDQLVTGFKIPCHHSTPYIL